MPNEMTSRELPRELAPGLWWLGHCLHYPFKYKGSTLHAYNSVYLVAGDECSALIEGGFPGDVQHLELQIEKQLATGLPPLRYLFTTHTETPHCSSFGRLLEKYPDTVIIGDVSDLHLVFPGYEDRLRPLAPGDSVDLGGTELKIIESVIRDYIYTRWAFDTSRKVLFTGDGVAYSHYHAAGQCASIAEEVPELDVADMTALFGELAFFWTRFTDPEPFIKRLHEMLFDELDVSIVAPTHGLPITNPDRTMPAVYEGFRLGGVAPATPRL
jgi:flavorubredoxin